MANFDATDLFNDMSLVNDPYPYLEHLRAKGPAVRLPNGVVAVTGYDEGVAIWRDDERYSAVNAVSGPFPPLPFTPEGEDITAQIEQHRSEIPFAGLIAAQDPPLHAKIKGLLMGIITPRRLKENEAFMWRLADQQIDAFIGRGSVEVLSGFAQPFATLVIADLLGVPDEDRATFNALIASLSGLPGKVGGDNSDAANNPLAQIGMHFYGYIEDRRREPREDVLTGLAQAKFPDGSLPPVLDVVSIATFLFAAGQDTTTRLFMSMLRFLAEDPQLQQTLRNERQRIPDFIEEVLRLEGTVKANFRLTKVPVKIGDLEMAPGTTVMVMINAMDRDPRRFENPSAFQLDRKNVRDQVAFSRGIHACPGAPLGRAEAKVVLERLFDRTSDIRINEAKHGPAGARRFEYEPTYMFRAMKELHLEFTPKA